MCYKWGILEHERYLYCIRDRARHPFIGKVIFLRCQRFHIKTQERTENYPIVLVITSAELLEHIMGIEDYDTELYLVTMSVHFLIAELMDLDIMDIESDSSLEIDLGMTGRLRKIFSGSIKEMFDGFELDYLFIKTVQDVINQVITCKLNTDYMTLH